LHLKAGYEKNVVFIVCLLSYYPIDFYVDNYGKIYYNIKKQRKGGVCFAVFSV